VVPEAKREDDGCGLVPTRCFDETATRHNAASPENTQDGGIAYARFPPSRETRYPDGLLPD